MFYGQCWKCGERWGLGTASTCKCPDETPNREWVGLTDEEIENAIDDGLAFGLSDGNVSNEAVIRYVRAIEAKLKERNTCT